MSLPNQTKKYISVCATMLTFGAALSPSYSNAAGEVNKTVTKDTTINVNQNVVVFSGRMSLGLLNGESGEYVNLTDISHRLSQLTWKLDNVYMLGFGGSVAPLPWLKFNADISFKLNNGNGVMDDYDWMTLSTDWSDWSHHENVDLKTGWMLDLNSEMVFYKWEGNRFFLTVGFKYDDWKWQVHGGDFIYSTFDTSRDMVGSFPDDALAITYEQKYYTPYIGIGFSSDLNPTPITFSGRIIGSTFAFGESTDQHHMRDLVSEDKYNSGQMLGVDLAGAYNFTKNFSLMLSYHYQVYKNFEDDAHRKDLTTGVTTTYTSAQDSMDHHSDMFSVSAIVNF